MSYFILKLVGEERKMVSVIIIRKKNWIGHTLRHEGLLRDVIEGKMLGKRPRGRPRIGMLNELKEGSYGQMKRRDEDSIGWKCWNPETCHLTEHYRRRHLHTDLHSEFYVVFMPSSGHTSDVS